MKPLYRFCRDVSHLFFKLYGRVEVIGREKIPSSGPVIIAANHVSYLDPPLVGSTMRREGYFMARHDLWKNRLFGRFIESINAFPVNRDRPDTSTFRKALDVLRQGYILALFPEGTRSPDGQLQRAHSGIAFIVQKSGAPVIPTALIGTEIMWPPGQRWPKRAKVKIVYGDPVFFTPDSSREEIVTAIMRAIAELLTAHGHPSVAAEDREAKTPG